MVCYTSKWEGTRIDRYTFKKPNIPGSFIQNGMNQIEEQLEKTTLKINEVFGNNCVRNNFVRGINRGVMVCLH